MHFSNGGPANVAILEAQDMMPSNPSFDCLSSD
jgi:hypothetical protein